MPTDITTNVTSSSQWTLDPQAFMPLPTFASTRIPDVSISQVLSSMGTEAGFTIESLLQVFQSAKGSISRIDLCTSLDSNGVGQLKIIKFSELSNSGLLPGDIAIWIQQDGSSNWQSQPVEMIKQRGYHSELVIPRNGQLCFAAPWNDSMGTLASGDLRITPIGNIHSHPEYQSFASGGRGSYSNKDWNFHLFRLTPNDAVSPGDWEKLMNGIEGWVSIFSNTVWPGPGDNDWWRNPVLFSDAEELLHIGDSLLRGEPKPVMFCIQWVQAIICLAACYPLTSSMLTSRNTMGCINAGVKMLGENITPLAELPMAPYKPDYIVDSFIRTYWPGQDFGEGLIDALLAHIPLPQQTILPIAPLLESRQRSNPSNAAVNYLLTAFEDQFCVGK
jgi:hypothetical protein